MVSGDLKSVVAAINANIMLVVSLFIEIGKTNWTSFNKLKN